MAGAALQPSATAQRSPSRVIDRTFVCTPIAFGGIGDLDVLANPSRQDQFGRAFVGLLEVRTGGSQSDTSLVFVRARAQPRHPGLAIPWPASGRAGTFAHARRCTAARVSIPLSPKGLPGPPVAWNKSLDCRVTGRVVVRVRSVLQSPAPWQKVDRAYVGARKPVLEAKVAVRAERTRAPLAYMELGRTGATRLWYSSACS